MPGWVVPTAMALGTVVLIFGFLELLEPGFLRTLWQEFRSIHRN